MHIRPALLIWSILTLFVVNGLAQTDSVYSKMTLGSAGYYTKFGNPSKYARPQATLLARLQSDELAERAVRKCFSAQQTQPTNATFKIYANKCVAALKVNVTSGDTVLLALGNPMINNLVPKVYLDQLMLVFQEDNNIYIINTNRKTLDSLDELVDSAFVKMMETRDALVTFCNTPELRSHTHKLLYQLFDTVAVLKRELYAIGYDTHLVVSMFYLLDTAMHRLPLAYKDTVSEHWDKNFAGAGLAVYDCAYILTVFRSNLNVMLRVFNDSTLSLKYRESHKEPAMDLFDGILTSNKVTDLYKYDDRKSETPANGKTFATVNQQYERNTKTYCQLVSQRMTTMIERAGIVPGAYILCRASNLKC